MPVSNRIVIADDQQDLLESLEIMLQAEGFETTTTSHPDALLEAVKNNAFDCALIDLNFTRDTTSGSEGIQLLKQLQHLAPKLPVVVMTAWATVDLVVDAMRHGARDFVEKPWSNQRLISVLNTQIELGRTILERDRLREHNQVLQGGPGESGFVAQARAMQPVMKLVDQVAPSYANILITGENGCGKSLLAKLIHEKSLRADRPLISVNMGAIPESVFESEMFGHVKGAFTDAKKERLGRFELANEGTLFLDEIANIPMPLQGKLLRVLESGEFERIGSSHTLTADVRLISATNADVSAMIEDGQFRQDLLYRLNTVEIALPPLRTRLEDIEPLAMQFLTAWGQKYRRAAPCLSGEALNVLKAYSWPGNVRELSHVIERAALLCRQETITPEDLMLDASTGEAATDVPDITIEALEQLAIERALERHSGDVKAAAKGLGLSRSGLYRRLQKFGLTDRSD